MKNKYVKAALIVLVALFVLQAFDVWRSEDDGGCISFGHFYVCGELMHHN